MQTAAARVGLTAPTRRLTLVRASILLAVALALGLRLYLLSRPNFLTGPTTYDDGTDFGSALRLVQGSLPYRDYVLVQPPGIALLLSPLAFLAKAIGTDAAFATARILTACVGVVGVLLVGLLVRHRGVLAVTLACGILAVNPDGVVDASTVYLEPWLMLFCLLGALVVFRGDELTSSRTRLALGGLAFGVAAAIKVWAVLPILLLSWLCWRSCGRRGVVAYVGGVVAGVAIPVIPFAVMAPDTFFNSVVVAQLSRTDPTRVPILWRLASLSGVTDLSAGGAIVILPSLAIAGLVLAWVAQATRTRHRSLPALDRFVIWSLVAATVAFLLPTDYYPHYAGFFAPFLGLAVALSVAGLSRRLGPTSKRRLIVAATIGVAVMAGVRLVTEVGQSEPAMTAWVDRLVPPGSCVVTDNSSMTIAADRFFSTDPKCSKMVDAFGTSIALADGRNGLTASSRDVRLQAVWLSGLQHARFVWFQCGPAASTSCDERAGTNRLVPWTPEILDYFRHHFRPRAEGPGPLTKRLAYLYARVPG